MNWRVGILYFGVVCASSAVIMIKACTVDPLALACYRLLVAVAALMPLYLRDRRRHNFRMTRRQFALVALAGLLIGGHFVSWIFGCRKTLVPNASLIVNLLPIAMPFLLYFMVRERLTRGEIGGTVLSLVGLGLLVGLDLQFSTEHFAGDSLCFLAMVLLAAYLAIGRVSHSFPTVWLYVVPLYFFGALACLAGALVVGSPLAVNGLQDWLMVVGLGIIPTVIGHSAFSYSMRHLRGQTVSIANLTEFIWSTIMGMIFLTGEFPRWNFYVAAALAMVGAVWVVKSPPPQHEELLQAPEL